MSTKLYKNTEGKVLMSVGNKLIKQPYEFGLAFQNRMGLNNYIKIDNLNILILNMSYYYSYNGTGGNSNLFSFESSINSYSTYIYNSDATISFTKNGRLSNNINLITSSSNNIINGKNNLCFSLSETNFTTLKNSTLRTSTPNISYITESSIIKLLIGAYSVSKIINSYSIDKINRVVVYSRYVNSSEMLYYYNNALGNDPQSMLNIEIDIHLDKAEILDFSLLQDGSDMRVGCRDYSGFNRHGEIMNLPAGTLQQKVDYANANLFVPFQ